MENTSDSFKPGPLLFCMKIERSVCYKVTDNNECEAEMEKVVQWIGKRKLHGRVRVAFIEESYERQGYRMGIPKQAYVSRVLANIRKEER